MISFMKHSETCGTWTKAPIENIFVSWRSEQISSLPAFFIAEPESWTFSGSSVRTSRRKVSGQFEKEYKLRLVFGNVLFWPNWQRKMAGIKVYILQGMMRKETIEMLS